MGEWRTQNTVSRHFSLLVPETSEVVYIEFKYSKIHATSNLNYCSSKWFQRTLLIYTCTFVVPILYV